METLFSGIEAEEVHFGIKEQRLDDCLNEAYAVHYYVSNWAKTND